ncbi:PolC-type DNA polymerase III [bacterium]|nr:PolC-type DNA polymerase III [bacterium]
MENKIHILLKAFGIENEVIENNLILSSIVIDKETDEANLEFEALKPLPIMDMRDFCDTLDHKKLPGTKGIKYSFSFKSYVEDDLKDYYRFVIQRVAKNSPRAIVGASYETSYEDGIFTIKVPGDDSVFSLNRKEIIEEFKILGYKDFELKIEVNHTEIDIREKIEKEKSEMINETRKNNKQESYISYNPLKEVVGQPLELSDVPDNEEEFLLFKENQKNWTFVIQGHITFIDTENLSKKNVVKFIIYDGKSYVYCTRRRLQTKEESKYFRYLKIGMHVKVQAYPEYSTFTKDVSMHIVNMKHSLDVLPITERVDTKAKKRVELHLHTKMSTLDGVPEMNDYIEAATIFGHKALAVTDHASVQSFHDLYEYGEKHPDFKPIYGVELCYVDQDKILAAYNPKNIDLENATYTVFDLETTGFSVNYERIIEIGAVKIKNGIQLGEFSELVNPEKNIPSSVVSITGITNRDVERARTREEVLKDFHKFIEGTILVAHNAEFDMSHLIENFDALGIEHPDYPVIDTLVLAKVLYPERKRYGLDALSKFLNVNLENHHRAVNDARSTEEIFLHMLEEVKKRGITNHLEINSLINKKDSYKYPIPGHINLIAKTQEGLKNLYHILSIASTDYFTSEAILTKDVLEKYRNGILVGSGCRNSYFFDTAFRKNSKELEEIIDLYDYIEVQPQNSFEYYKYHMDDFGYCYQDTIKKIISLAKKHSIPVCATGDCHQINKEDTIYRDILVQTDPVGGERFHYLKHEKEIPAEYFMTTDEMLEEFSFLGENLAQEIVVDNTNMIADACDNVKAFTKTLYPPKDNFMEKYGYESAEGYVNGEVYRKAKELYGDLIPGIVLDRIKGELESINKNKFSTVYLISKVLVERSRQDGYVVGSRGSVGSSFVAYLLSITEVNSLPPHYRCPKCYFSSFKMTKEEKEKYGIRKDEEKIVPILDKVLTGFDLPDHACPVCGTKLERDGHDIPFETFLGVPEDPKTPDIDLNFSGENQGTIHEYIREIFGMTKAFRAGTILTCMDKTAYAIVRDYFTDKNENRAKEGLEPIHHKKAEIEALSFKIIGSKRTSSKHPGGIVVVPVDHEIYEVTPVQYPGDSKDKSWKTTHFDYHSFEKNLFKLDILGHDDPTVLRYLMKYVQKYPKDFPFSDAMDIPVNDFSLYQLMNNTKGIKCNPSDICSNVATYGISEFGTSFVRGLLEEAKPSTFAELVKVSGLSHGTDVWNDNAQDLISGKAKGLPNVKVDFKDIIGCRDDIMVDLISYGVPADLAFKTMEFVRKGKPLQDENKWNGFIEKLSQYPIPNWYIWSCSKIQYMFPKAHATAYVIMALRIAWFKLYRPIFFYSAILSKKMVAYDVQVMTQGPAQIKAELENLKSKPQVERKNKDDDLITTLELCLEMTMRGYKFYMVDLEKSEAVDFAVSEDKNGLYIPFGAIDGCGQTVAQSIIDARNEKPFTTKNDFMDRTRVSKTIFKKLEDFGVFGKLPDDNQMTLDLEF